ncbi:MAG: type II toxin-antitoxin system HicB family antitoxin [Eubacterium sp.]|nr:type II toxin-antitoxin system HicB family antitoxin [Eubacterium sp.]
MSERTIEYYMELHYKMVIVQDDEGLYTAYYPDLPGCITTDSSPDELFRNALDAKRCWIRAALEDGIEISEPSEVGYQIR